MLEDRTVEVLYRPDTLLSLTESSTTTFVITLVGLVTVGPMMIGILYAAATGWRPPVTAAVLATLYISTYTGIVAAESSRVEAVSSSIDTQLVQAVEAQTGGLIQDTGKIGGWRAPGPDPEDWPRGVVTSKGGTEQTQCSIGALQYTQERIVVQLQCEDELPGPS